MTSHTPVAPRLSGSILYTLISVFSLTLITACGGGGLSLDLNISDPESRLIARCLANPFTDECNTRTEKNAERNAKTFADARAGFITGCVEDATSDLCEIATEFTCEGETGETNERGNPFAPLCQTDANSDTYELARMSTIGICIDPNNPNGFDLTSRFCVNAIEVTCADDAERTANPALCAGFQTDQTIVNTCDSDIFNSACDGNPIYIGQRNAHCATSPSDIRCAPLILSTCTFVASTDANNDNSTGDPFDALCRTSANSATYEASRNTIITACTTDLRGRLCANATTHACKINPFHALCYDTSATAFQAARQTAVTNCGDGTTTITEQVCADAVEQTCEGASADIFNALCGAYSGQAAQTAACGANPPADSRCYLQEQIDACAEGREISRCAQVGTGDISTCAADPFAAACVADGSPFAPYLADAQVKRYAYCGETGRSATDPVCASYRACADAPTTTGCGTSFDAALQATCEATPFDSQCASSIYNSDKEAFCSINEGGVNNLFHGSCTEAYRNDVARNTFCLAEPFDANCNANPDYAAARIANCEGDSPSASCITAAALFKSPAKKPSTASTTAKFPNGHLNIGLEDDGTITPIIGTIVTTTMIQDPNGESGAMISQTSEADETPTIQNVSIVRRGGGDADSNDDGYAFFQLVRAGTAEADLRTSYHAAILPDTNLGAPLVGAPTFAIWPGHFSTLRTATITGGAATVTEQTAVDFYIDWTAKKIGFVNPTRDGIGVHPTPGSLTENRPQAAILGQLRLNVAFTTGGILSGDATVADTGSQNVLGVFGLIGQEGVVAVFLPKLGHLAGAGGFTASNPDHRTYVAPVVENSNAGNEDADDNAALVTYQDWVGTFAPKAAPTTPRISEILQTSTSTGGRRISGLTNGQNALIRDFSVAEFRSPLAKGDAKNGFAVFAENNNYYAGILHTADLGAPITTPSGQALWRGEFSVQETQNNSVSTTRQFNLTVTFAGESGTFSGTIRDSLAQTTPLPIILYGIGGSFNGQGVISGTATRAVGQIGAPISGIIGQAGAIGVFVSDVANNKFAGGFVAVPDTAGDADYDTWARSIPLTGGGLEAVPRAYNHWLHGGVSSVGAPVKFGQSRANITGADGVNEGFIRLSDATWRVVALGGSNGNGVAFYSGELNAGRRQYYSGLFAQTDLGAPLTQTEGHADWFGHLDAIQGAPQGIVGRRSGDIIIRVNFTPAGGTITSVLPANRYSSVGYRYEISGNFNADGFLRGNVNTRTTSGGFEQGFLTGLIGQHGVVGAFVAPNVSGGFVASPRHPRKVGDVVYQDFLHYVQVRNEAITHLPHNETGRLNEILLTSNTAPYNVSYGNIRTDDGAYSGSVTVDAVFGADTKPAGLTGGYSHIFGVWNAHDGLGEFQTRLQRAYHAGLHPNTNVGPPLETRSSNVTLNFKARISIRGSKTFKYGNLSPVYADNAEFRMSINLRPDKKAISSPDSQASRNPIGGTFHSLRATWDDRGVLTGTIDNNHANYPNGRVLGLIGKNGAVAVIISDYNRHYGYSGGLVACPTVKNDGRSACIP